MEGQQFKRSKELIAFLCILAVLFIGIFSIIPSGPTAESSFLDTSSDESTSSNNDSILFNNQGDSNQEDSSAPDALPFEIDRIYATSFLVENGKEFNVENIFDGDVTTTWAEGVSGLGFGETITVYFIGSPTISGIRINTGYQKDRDSFLKNARPYLFFITFSDNSFEMIEIEKNEMGEQEVMFSNPVETSSVIIRLQGIEPGSAYEDSCISEIDFITPN